MRDFLKWWSSLVLKTFTVPAETIPSPNLLLASFAALLHCLSTFKSLCTITPKSLSLFCAPSTLSPNLTSIPSLANPKCITAHFSRLNSICQFPNHLNNSIRVSLSSSDPTLATNFVSSANLSTVLRIGSQSSRHTVNSTRSTRRVQSWPCVEMTVCRAVGYVNYLFYCIIIIVLFVLFRLWI